VTEAEIRSLAISQRLLGTQEIVLIHHTDCGMTKFNDGEFVAALKAELGVAPDWAPGAISDIAASVRASIAAIQASPFIPRKDAIRGFVYDVGTGVLREVG
jgi:carbonic anhydrase